MKANNHPLVKDLRKILDKHGLQGAVLLSITDNGQALTASAGKTVKACDALAPLIKDGTVADELLFEMDFALQASK